MVPGKALFTLPVALPRTNPVGLSPSSSEVVSETLKRAADQCSAFPSGKTFQDEGDQHVMKMIAKKRKVKRFTLFLGRTPFQWSFNALSAPLF